MNLGDFSGNRGREIQRQRARRRVQRCSKPRGGITVTEGRRGPDTGRPKFRLSLPGLGANGQPPLLVIHACATGQGGQGPADKKRSGQLQSTGMEHEIVRN